MGKVVLKTWEDAIRYAHRYANGEFYPAADYEALERELKESKYLYDMASERIERDREKISALERRFAEVEAERDKLRDICFKSGAMNKPPCFNCGYNGPGYFNPDKHPCAAFHHYPGYGVCRADLRREGE